MKKLTVFFCALWCVLICCGCALGADGDRAFFGDAAAYEASAFQKQLTECVAEEKTQGQWRFLPDSAVDENELSRCMDWLLHESPEGAYELRKVTYSFREHAEYLEVKVDFSYRADAVPAEEIVAVETLYDAVAALMTAMECGETEVVLRREGQWDWQQELGDLVSIAATNAIVPAEFRDFSYSCYGSDGSIVHISMEMPLSENTYRTLTQELETAVSSAAEEIFVRGGDAEEIYRAAHSYVVVNTAYDAALAERSLGKTYFSEADLVSRSAYGALCQGKSVCSGYAQAFQALCRAMDLPCWTVYGTVAGEGEEWEEHVWNAVLLGGEVYYVDCTFDDGLQSREYFLFTEEDPQYSKYQVYSGWLMPW
ncbi:MAG: hypothetical protein IKU12_00375 [Oscillospiraceae bacterium]|nr:hypothetical protein [Oscillospiraceae bacterium]